MCLCACVVRSSQVLLTSFLPHLIFDAQVCVLRSGALACLRDPLPYLPVGFLAPVIMDGSVTRCCVESLLCCAGVVYISPSSSVCITAFPLLVSAISWSPYLVTSSTPSRTSTLFRHGWFPFTHRRFLPLARFCGVLLFLRCFVLSPIRFSCRCRLSPLARAVVERCGCD